MTSGRWQVEQVLALAPRPSSVSAAQPLAVPARWTSTGCDDRAVWGRCIGTSAEPYECAVDHLDVAFRCSCPSRVFPCKHALALLLLWARGQVAEGSAPPFAASWIAKRLATAATAEPAVVETPAPVDAVAEAETAAPTLLPPPLEPNKTRDDRIARMSAGLAELDRWLDDRVRTGLADPSLASYKTWDGLAARLIDAQVGGLANRVRRLAGLVGAHPDWHSQVLAELGVLHLLATSGRHLGALPVDLADSVAATIGWQVRQADVLAGVPLTDHWVVMGRSDVREDRIEVRRIWLRGASSREWAMVLSFAAYQQTLDTSFAVGTQVHADLFRYPGAVALRVLVGAAPQRAGTRRSARRFVDRRGLRAGRSRARRRTVARALSGVPARRADAGRRSLGVDGFDRVDAIASTEPSSEPCWRAPAAVRPSSPPSGPLPGWCR